MSTPQEEARNASINPYDITKSISWSVIFIDLSLLLIAMMIINYKLKIKDKRISILDSIILHTCRIQRQFKNKRRKIMFFSILIYSFLFYIIIASSLSSELVVDIPAKYLQNLEDVLASNRTPTLIEGRDKITNSQGNLDVKHLLLKRAEERKADLEGMKSRSVYSMMTMGITKQRMVGLFESKMKANGLRQVICMMNKKSKTYPKVKISDPFGYVIVGFYYSLKITDQLAHRMTVTYQRIVQSGLLMRIETKVDKQHLKCVFMMEMTIQRDREDVPLPFKIFAPILCLFSIGLVFAMFCFVSECLTAIIITNISNFISTTTANIIN